MQGGISKVLDKLNKIIYEYLEEFQAPELKQSFHGI